MRILFVLIFFLGLNVACSAQRVRDLNSFTGKIFFKEAEEGNYELRKMFNNFSGAAVRAENPRLTAIALNITLGLFGMHRLYLGTDLTVAVAYTFTMGGGCVLWLVDLGLLIFTKDITPYYNNPGMFMWTGK